MSNTIILTIFTPAYNRAHTLERTYLSLMDQDCKDFIWLIVDDGSSDNTRELVKKFQSRENGFEIQYVYKENGGMHTAHNTAYENIHTELNTCIDSDDCLAKGAVRAILDKWAEVKNKGYAGLIALDADMDGKIIGKGFPENLKGTTVSDYYNQGGCGDKKLIYRTDIIKQYPEYPVFEGEKYVSLSYKYLLIDQKYELAVLNEIVCNVDYQQDGSTNTMFKQYVKNPKGFAFWRRIRMQYNKKFSRDLIDAMHYVSSCIFCKDWKCISKSPKKIKTILMIPFGICLNVYIRYKVKCKV